MNTTPTMMDWLTVPCDWAVTQMCTGLPWAKRLMLIVVCLLVVQPAMADDVLKKRVVNAIGMEFVLIPAGSFIMGSPLDEAYRGVSEIQHPVTITRPFYMQTTEVTVDQWRAVLGRRWFARKRGAGDMPVVKVSWHDCQKFISQLNHTTSMRFALPTEAQWEYAARAGSAEAFFWGGEINCDQAMFANNPMKYDRCVTTSTSSGLQSGQPAAVKSYAPNAWGLFDMHGNVWEWCQDLYHRYDTVSVVDPCETESGKNRVRRGGSWFGPGYSCRSANRAFGHPMSRLQNTGFRLVMIVPDPPSKSDASP